MEVGDPTDLEVRIEVLSRDGVAIDGCAGCCSSNGVAPDPLTARVRAGRAFRVHQESLRSASRARVYVVADFVDPIERRPTLVTATASEARVVGLENPNALRAPAGALFQTPR